MPGTLNLILGTEIVSTKRIKCSDLTKPYNVIGNPFGWYYGTIPGPNPYIQNILTADMFIVPPSGIQYDIDLLALAVPMYDITAGAIIADYLYEAPSIGLAADANLPDGKHSIQLEVTGEFVMDPVYNFSAQDTKIIYFLENSKCCVQKLNLKIYTATTAKAIKEATDNYNKAYLMLQGLINMTAFPCKNYTDADKALIELQDFCLKSECGCGC